MKDKGTGFRLPPRRLDLVGRMGSAVRVVRATDRPSEHVIGIPRIRDQGPTNSCTAFSGLEGAELIRRVRGEDSPILSPLALYWATRVTGEHSEQLTDSGVDPYALVSAASKLGVPPETDWPFDALRVNDRPPSVALLRAQRLKLSISPLYERGELLWDLVCSELSRGIPVMLALTVDEVFRAAKLDPIPPPKSSPEAMSHAVCAYGYDHAGNVLIANSWGLSFGNFGTALLSPEAVGAAVWAGAIEVPL